MHAAARAAKHAQQQQPAAAAAAAKRSGGGAQPAGGPSTRVDMATAQHARRAEAAHDEKGSRRKKKIGLRRFNA